MENAALQWAVHYCKWNDACVESSRKKKHTLGHVFESLSKPVWSRWPKKCFLFSFFEVFSWYKMSVRYRKCKVRRDHHRVCGKLGGALGCGGGSHLDLTLISLSLEDGWWRPRCSSGKLGGQANLQTRASGHSALKKLFGVSDWVAAAEAKWKRKPSLVIISSRLYPVLAREELCRMMKRR